MKMRGRVIVLFGFDGPFRQKGETNEIIRYNKSNEQLGLPKSYEGRIPAIENPP